MLCKRTTEYNESFKSPSLVLSVKFDHWLDTNDFETEYLIELE